MVVFLAETAPIILQFFPLIEQPNNLKGAVGVVLVVPIDAILGM
jgi:hypothetical protein